LRQKTPADPDLQYMSSSTQNARREAFLARALDPGAVVNAFVLKVALQGRDPHWRERDSYSPPLPTDAVSALEFVSELGY
jgi:hypothetical protein